MVLGGSSLSYLTPSWDRYNTNLLKSIFWEKGNICRTEISSDHLIFMYTRQSASVSPMRS